MDSMFQNARSFKQTLCGEAWANSQASKDKMFSGDLPDSISTMACGAVHWHYFRFHFSFSCFFVCFIAPTYTPTPTPVPAHHHRKLHSLYLLKMYTRFTFISEHTHTHTHTHTPLPTPIVTNTMSHHTATWNKATQKITYSWLPSIHHSVLTSVSTGAQRRCRWM